MFPGRKLKPSSIFRIISNKTGRTTKESILRGRTLINVFFENSTRTRTSFELAGKRLGADVINMSVSSGAIKKGETLIDTAMTLNAMHPDVLTVRHADSGAVQLLSEKVTCSVLNVATAATNTRPRRCRCADHPATPGHSGKADRRHLRRYRPLRVAQSNIYLLNTMGAKVRLVAPKTLLPAAIDKFGVDVHHRMEDGIRDADIIMMLRLQTERMQGSFVPSTRGIFRFFGLDREKLAVARPDALIMHPGPMNRESRSTPNSRTISTAASSTNRWKWASPSRWPVSTRDTEPVAQCERRRRVTALRLYNARLIDPASKTDVGVRC